METNTQTMTIEQLKQQLNTARELMQNKAAEYVSAYNTRYENRTPETTLREMKTNATKAVKDHNAILEKLTYKLWNEEGDAVRTALRMYYIPNAQTVTFPEDKNTGMLSVMFKPSDMKINLLTMSQTIGVEAFNAERWYERVEALALIIADDLSSEIVPHSPFHYEVTPAAREFGFKYNADMTKREKSIAALQQTFDGILFIPTNDNTNRIQADGPAWTFIRECMTAHGAKNGQVAILSPCQMCALVAEAMHIYITNGLMSLVCA